MLPGETIIKRGSWLYDGSVWSRLILVRADAFVGSGDEADAPEICNERKVKTFRVWFESPPGSGDFPTASRQYLSEQEAMEDLNKVLPSPPQWE